MPVNGSTIHDYFVRKTDRGCVTISSSMSAEATFSALFRKYRLKSEFETLSEFGLALAEKGFLYEESIFSHWQKGTRVPQNRVVLLKLLDIFIEKHAITT